MKTLLIYSSLTGNTKKVAEAIHQVMPTGTEIFAIENAPNPQDYDFIVLGYWVDKGTADLRTIEYINKMQNKKVAVFGTLGAYPDSDHAHKCRSKVKELLVNNNFLGDYICQGAVDPNLSVKFLNFPKDHPHALNEKRLRRHLESQKHPDQADLENAKQVFKQIVADITN